MIERYGTFMALDGTEFPYTDFRQAAGRQRPRPMRMTRRLLPRARSKKADH